MLDITKSRVFDYDEGRKAVVVYQGYEAENLWYIVPEPMFAVGEGGVPQFSLVRYETNEGVSGICSFIVELNVTPEAKAVVERELPGAHFGQFVWEETAAYFRYFLNSKEILVTVTPSGYSLNQAAFVIQLPNEEAVRTFENGFGPTGVGASPFTLFYDVTTLTLLRAVEATVSYDAQIAHEYEKQVNISKDTWGNEKSRNTTIKETLRQSDAGDTQIIFKIENPSAELQQRVYDWAWTTLEGLVEQAVVTALDRFGPGNADNFSMKYTGSFWRIYKEATVVEWLIEPITILPRFAQATWDKVYVIADQRQFSTSFTLRQLTSGDEKIKIDSVTVQTRYPTGTSQYTGNHTFEADTEPTWVWDAPGVIEEGQFVPFYDYKYLVRFQDNNNNYESDWITTDETDIQLTPGQLTFLNVNFTARNINFEEVDYIVVDFIFITPDNTPPIQQQFTIHNNETYTVVSALRLPSANEYEYSLLYVMKDQQTYKVAPIKTNQENVSIQSPFTTKTVTLWLLTSDEIKQAFVTARYEDKENSIQQGTNFTLTKQESFATWNVNVVDNPNGFIIEYGGVIVFEDQTQRVIPNVRLVGDSVFSVSAIQEWFTVTIDPQLIKWEEAGEQYIVLVDASFYLLKTSEEGAGEPIKEQQQTFSFEKNYHPLQYWSFLRDVGTAATYYYEVQYHHADGTSRHVAQTTEDITKVTLPPDGQSPQPHSNAVTVPENYVQYIS